MSLIYITFHNENISDIEKRAISEEHYKFPKYKSIHRSIVKDLPPNQIEQQGKKVISASNKFLHKTMGYAETPLDNPSAFLKKNGGIKWQKVNDHVCPPARDIPPVPKKGDVKIKENQQKVNFIKRNIKRIKTAVPPSIAEKIVDTVIGERHNLDGTGLVPEYVFSKQFGKPPSYLKSIKKALEARTCYNQKDTTEGISMLRDSERNAILMGLRANHLELEKTYQLLPIFTDTNSKKQRKAKLEQELKRLEQDILLMQSNPVILICGE